MQLGSDYNIHGISQGYIQSSYRPNDNAYEVCASFLIQEEPTFGSLVHRTAIHSAEIFTGASFQFEQGEGAKQNILICDGVGFFVDARAE